MIYFGNFNLNVPSYFRHKQLGNWKISWNFHEARNKSDAHKPSAFEYCSWKYGSQRDLCSCSWGTLENSSKNLRPEFQRRRTKEKNEIQHFFHLATTPSWNAITVSGVSLIFGLKKRWEILGQAATILRKFITVCLEGVVQSWAESKVEENQSQIGEIVSWCQATTRRAAGLHHIFQSLKAEEEDRVKRVNILAKPTETGPQMYL